MLFQEIGFSAVTLTDPSYYTVPEAKELQLDSSGDCWVENFVVGHKIHGRARFPGKNNVARLDVDRTGKKLSPRQEN